MEAFRKRSDDLNCESAQHNPPAVIDPRMPLNRKHKPPQPTLRPKNILIAM